MIRGFSNRKGGIWYSIALNREGKLLACAFSDRNRSEAQKAVTKSLPKALKGRLHWQRASSKYLPILISFYEGSGRKTDLRTVDLSGVSKFRGDVYNLLCKIPLGKVTTYGAIAKKLGGRRYSRAVGTAVATNPLPLIVPCHRVLPCSLRVGNYGMCGRNPGKGGYMKQKLLRREGVMFEGERVSKQSTWIPN